MAYAQRVALYKKLERARKRPVISFVTSARRGAGGLMAADSVAEFIAQLQALPRKVEALDVLLVSNGGDPTVSIRLVSVIRERVKKFSVLVPQAAFSAATLLALGADEIVMHPMGNLGPVDPQIDGGGKPNQKEFGTEDLAAFLAFVKEHVGEDGAPNLAAAFTKFCDTVGPIAIGIAARSSQLLLEAGETLLLSHMQGANEKEQAKKISSSLNKRFRHHGYPVGRKEAREIGLKIVDPTTEVERLMWSIWTDFEAELQVREPFNPVSLILANPACAALLAPVPQVVIPAGLPPAMLPQIVNQVLQQCQITVTMVPPTSYELVHAAMESPRLGTQFRTKGKLLGMRSPDGDIKMTNVTLSQAWQPCNVA